MGALDHARARITARIGALFLTQLDQRVFALAMRSTQSGKRKEPQAALKDLLSIEKFIACSICPGYRYFLPAYTCFIQCLVP